MPVIDNSSKKLIDMVLCNGVVGNLKALFSEDRQEKDSMTELPCNIRI